MTLMNDESKIVCFASKQANQQTSNGNIAVH